MALTLLKDVIFVSPRYLDDSKDMSDVSKVNWDEKGRSQRNEPALTFTKKTHFSSVPGVVWLRSSGEAVINMAKWYTIELNIWLCAGVGHACASWHFVCSPSLLHCVDTWTTLVLEYTTVTAAPEWTFTTSEYAGDRISRVVCWVTYFLLALRSAKLDFHRRLAP